MLHNSANIKNDIKQSPHRWKLEQIQADRFHDKSLLEHTERATIQHGEVTELGRGCVINTKTHSVEQTKNISLI